MAKSNNNPYLPDETRLQTEVTDPRGDRVINLTATDRTITDAEGREVAVKTSQAILSVDGQILTASHLLSGKEPSGICPCCREGDRSWWRRQAPTHGICTLRNMEFCYGCHRRVCMLHTIFSNYDNRPRCPRCHRRHVRWALPKWLLTKPFAKQKTEE